MRFSARWIAHLPHAGAPLRSFPETGLVSVPVRGASLWVDPAPTATLETTTSIIVALPGKARVATKLMSHEPFEAALQIWSWLEIDERGLRVTSDFLGLMPGYRMDVHDGVLLSNQIALLKSVEPVQSQPMNRTGVIEFLTVLAPMGPRTLYQAISRLEPGSELLWDGQTLTLNVTPLTAPEVDNHTPTPRVIEQMDQLLMASLQEKVAHHDGSLFVSMSGGFDSRLTAGLLKRAGVNATLVSQGARHHDEVKAARAIARRVDLPWEVRPYPTNFLETHRKDFLSIFEGQVDPFILHVAALALSIGRDFDSLAHGFIGDAAAGQYLDKFDTHGYSSLDALAEGIVTYFARPLLVTFFEAAGWSDWRDCLRDAVRGSLLPAPHAYQSAMLWNYTCRQRRAISYQANAQGQRLSTLLPFLDWPYMRFMLGQPLQALDNRSLFRNYLASKFPSLAEVAHPSEAFAIRPRLSEMLGRTTSNLWRHVPGMEQLGRQRRLRDGRFDYNLQRLSYGGETPAARAKLQTIIYAATDRFHTMIGLDVPGDLDSICFPDGVFSYVGLDILRRLWALATVTQP
jgi:hypothetical protein